jgi:hypothetical protein
MLKVAIRLLLLLTPFNLMGQINNDTLFYKSGMERVCHVNYFDLKNVNYTYTSSKGDTLTNSMKVDQLKYFVIYDSLGILQFSSRDGIEKAIEQDTTDFFEAPDSMIISRHMLSVNPLSIPFLAINASYTYRFGVNKQFGIHVPFRTISPYLYGGYMAVYTGVGFTAFIVNQEKYSMTVDLTPSVYFFEDGAGAVTFALPVTIGFVRYLRSNFAIDGRIGLGPGFSKDGLSGFPIPAAHIGFAFLLGEKYRIKAD